MEVFNKEESFKEQDNWFKREVTKALLYSDSPETKWVDSEDVYL